MIQLSFLQLRLGILPVIQGIAYPPQVPGGWWLLGGGLNCIEQIRCLESFCLGTWVQKTWMWPLVSQVCHHTCVPMCPLQWFLGRSLVTALAGIQGIQSQRSKSPSGGVFFKGRLAPGCWLRSFLEFGCSKSGSFFRKPASDRTWSLMIKPY